MKPNPTDKKRPFFCLQSFCLLLLLALLTALHPADAPKPKANPDQFAGIDPDDGTAPRPDKAIPPKLIANPGSTTDYTRAKRTCTGVPSMAVSRGGRLWVAWFGVDHARLTFYHNGVQHRQSVQQISGAGPFTEA